MLCTAVVAQSVRAFAFYARGLLFETQPQETLFITRSDIYTANRSTTGVSVTGPQK